MKRVVLDASVAAKWFLPAGEETLLPEALDLLQQYAEGGISLIVPDLFWAELGNLLWKATRQSRCTPAAARSALVSLGERQFMTVASSGLIEAAFDIAVLFNRTVYDSLYVALAIDSKGLFVTADERLANAVGTRLPVKWLGAM